MSLWPGIVYLLASTNLLWLAYEDFKHRSVPLLSLIIHGIFCLLVWWQTWPGAAIHFQEVVVNLGFIGLQFALVSLIMYASRKDFSWRKSLGLGDLVFIFCNALCWQTSLFLGAYLGGLIGGIILAIYLAKTWPKAQHAIPLITTLAIAQLFALLYFIYF